MKVYIFKKEDNDFSHILTDPTMKGKFKTKITWKEHLLLGVEKELSSEIESYIILKFGDELITNGLIRDFSPVPYVDYMPDPNRPAKFKDVYK